MASTSKYLQLTPQVLVEYIYTDQASPEVIETNVTGARIMLLSDTYTNTKYLFNEDNPATVTGNSRALSSIAINSDKTRYAYLTTNTALNYLDYDPTIINTDDLLAQVTSAPNLPVKQVQYDTIKVHLVSGYEFSEGQEGFIFEVLIKDRNNRKHNLTSLTYLKTDNYEVNNPSPFIVGEKLYSKYLLIKVPAANWLIDEYTLNPTNPNNLSNQLTNNIGLIFSGTIEFGFKYISAIEKNNGQTYFNIGESITASINKVDEFSLLSAVIQESVAGDYFELYGQYNGDIYEDFIFELNTKPNTSIMVIHEITVFEQVGTDFFKTSEQSFIQNEDFGEPYIFRPVLLNSHVAVSYRINYVLRIFNKADNTQIIRQSQFASFDVKKYGRHMRKINLGTVPTITKVYNKISDDSPNIILNNNVIRTVDASGKTVLKQTEFVIGFRERLRVSATTATVKVTQPIKEEGDITPTAPGNKVRVGQEASLSITSVATDSKIYPLGEAPINMTPFDNFFLFILYDNINQVAKGQAHPQLIDLTNMGTLYITFTGDSNEEVRIPNYTNIKDISPAQGEVLFKIGKDDAKKILGFKNKNYYISSRLEVGDFKSDETLVYNGTWHKIEDGVEQVKSQTISELQTQLEKIQALSTTNTDAQAARISDLEKELQRIADYNKKLEDKLKSIDANALSEVKGNVNPKLTVPLNLTTDVQIKEVTETKVKIGDDKFVSQVLYDKSKGMNIKNIKL